MPLAHGLAAHASGDMATAARLIGQAMPHLRTLGGSIAQRALFAVRRLAIRHPGNVVKIVTASFGVGRENKIGAFGRVFGHQPANS